MKIEKRIKKGVVILDLKGKILIGDDITVLRSSINELVKEKKLKLLINFEQVPYLDSTGLGEIVRTYTTLKKNGGETKILNLGAKVKDLMTITKLITVFEAFDDEDRAIESFC
jgi:anti-sigma B factor antagonist